MSEMTPLQARAVLEQIRDRNVAINSISDVLKRHDEAMAVLADYDAKVATKESQLVDMGRAMSLEQGKLDALKAERAGLATELNGRRAEALAKVEEESRKLAKKLHAEAVAKIEKGLQDFTADIEQKKSEAQAAIGQEKKRMDLEIASKQQTLDGLTDQIRRQIESLQRSI